MIRATITDKSISTEGHGQTRVCAAVSVLMQSTINSIIALTDDTIELESENGRHLIECGGFQHMTTKGRLLIDSLCLAFREMAQDYPDDFEIVQE